MRKILPFSLILPYYQSVKTKIVQYSSTILLIKKFITFTWIYINRLKTAGTRNSERKTWSSLFILVTFKNKKSFKADKENTTKGSLVLSSKLIKYKSSKWN